MSTKISNFSRRTSSTDFWSIRARRSSSNDINSGCICNFKTILQIHQIVCYILECVSRKRIHTYLVQQALDLGLAALVARLERVRFVHVKVGLGGARHQQAAEPRGAPHAQHVLKRTERQVARQLVQLVHQVGCGCWLRADLVENLFCVSKFGFGLENMNLPPTGITWMSFPTEQARNLFWLNAKF